MLFLSADIPSGVDFVTRMRYGPTEIKVTILHQHDAYRLLKEIEKWQKSLQEYIGDHYDESTYECHFYIDKVTKEKKRNEIRLSKHIRREKK